MSWGEFQGPEHGKVKGNGPVAPPVRTSIWSFYTAFLDIQYLGKGCIELADRVCEMMQ